MDACQQVGQRLRHLRQVRGYTQEQLAELAGTSRSTVNRVLRQEEKRGTVALRRGRTTVLDRDALARRARGHR